MNGEGEVAHDLVCNDPGPRQFVRKASVAAMEGRGVSIKGRMTVSKRAGPISKCD